MEDGWFMRFSRGGVCVVVGAVLEVFPVDGFPDAVLGDLRAPGEVFAFNENREGGNGDWFGAGVLDFDEESGGVEVVWKGGDAGLNAVVRGGPRAEGGRGGDGGRWWRSGCDWVGAAGEGGEGEKEKQAFGAAHGRSSGG